MIEEKNLAADRSNFDLHRAQMRASMCWALSTCLSIWSKGGKPKLTETEGDLTVYLGRAHVRRYTALAANALSRGQLLYKLRPKVHYFLHLLDELELWSNNPLSQSNFIDEDNMKTLRDAAIRCHAKTVKVSWCRRYILKKVLTWQKLKAAR